MVPSSKQNEMKVASSTNVHIGESEAYTYVNLVTLINKVAIFTYVNYMANVDGLSAANE